MYRDTASFDSAQTALFQGTRVWTMNTETRAPTRRREPERAPPSKSVPDAITRIAAGHAELLEMFTAFENTRSVANKRFLVQHICTSVAVQAQVQAELFYPAIETNPPQPKPEHSALDALVSHIQRLEPVSEQVDQPIEQLAQQVKLHVSTLRDVVFPQAQNSGVDLVELGERMARRKAELIAQQA